ncbi:DUF5671 domain-containing protein [Agrococcus carbonis]|uniref:DUF5671 domain-containing protein n=1 Tax=Agrococcus carbonis TaxID=684552 RepID=UPI000B81E17A|nr:DUF5671 domain-containing protein [Agrococcus carbonis]
MRRLILTLLLLVLVTIAASGVSGLLGRLLQTEADLGDPIAGLALSLAFTLIGGPLAVLVWWWLWRRLDGTDRSSVAWGLYLSAVATISLIVFSTSLLGAIADLVRGTWSPDAVATGVAWLAVWILHRIMWAHPTKSPLRLARVPIALGAGYGLGVAALGAIRVLEAVFAEATLPSVGSVGGAWWLSPLQAAIWAVGGAGIWWWHWRRDGAVAMRGGFPDVALVLTGVLGAGAVALGGFGVSLWIGLRAALDRSLPWRDLLEPLPLAVAAAAVGVVVWLSHRRVATERSAGTRSATRLVEAGLGLIAAASGVGIIANALLASLTPSLAGGDARALLLGGLASLAVGAPVWWAAWHPLDTAAHAADAGRRVYLVAVFGVSALVAIVALLVVGYRVFELVLDGGAGEGLVERIRAPFGLLLATAAVAGYHFAVWRRDRAAAPTTGRVRSIGRIILVAGGDDTSLAQQLEAATGAPVTRWTRADAQRADAHRPDASADAVLRALEGVSGRRVLVVTGRDGAVEAVPLVD